MSSNDDINIRDMLERVWRARWKIFFFQFLVVCATLFMILFWPRTYSSTALLQLQLGRENIGLDPTANATGQTIALQQSGRDSEIKSAIDVLLSRGITIPAVEKLTPEVVLGEVVIGDVEERHSNPISRAIKNAIGWTVQLIRKIDPSSKKERALIAIEQSLRVDAQRKSEVINVTFEAETPELAQAVTDAIVMEYRRQHASLHRTDGSEEFFVVHSERLNAELDAASETLRNTMSEMGITSIAEQRNIMAQQLGALRTDMMTNEKMLQGALAMAESLKDQLQQQPERLSSSSVTKPNAGADMQRQLLYALQIQEMDAKAKLTANHPKVRSLASQVAEAKSELAKQEAKRTESTDDINPVVGQLRLQQATNLSEIASLDAKKKQLETQETQLLADISQLNKFAVEVDQLERVVKVAEKKYLAYAENLEESHMDQAMEKAISNVTITQPATFQEKPVSPSKPVVALFGALMCFAGPLAIGLLSIQTDDTLISEYSLRKRIDVPVLGTVPQSRAYQRVLA